MKNVALQRIVSFYPHGRWVLKAEPVSGDGEDMHISRRNAGVGSEMEVKGTEACAGERLTVS